MLRRRLALSLLVAVGAAASPSIATAQESAPGAPFGARAANVLVVDELAGIYRETVAYPDRPNGTGNESGLLYVGSNSGVFAYNQTTRFGYHRFVTSEISVGAGLHYADRDLTLESLGGKETILGISPRVGFVLAPSEGGALWLRFGFQYYHYSFPNDASGWDLGPGVELFYVITPFEHFGITIGPTLEMQLAGNRTTTQQACTGTGGCVTLSHDEAIRRYTFGLALGFLFDL